MSSTVSAQTINKPLDKAKPGLNGALPTQVANYPEVLQLPSPICRGLIQRWQLRPGLDLIVHDVGFPEKTVIEQRPAQGKAHLGLSFCLSGQIRSVSAATKQVLQIQAGQVSLGVMGGGSRRVEYAARQRVLLVHLHVQPEAIGLASQETIERLPRRLKNVLTSRDRPLYFQSYSMTPVMAATVRQLLRCPYQGLSQKLYVESKTFELMSLYFDQLLSNPASQKQVSDLSSDEVDRIFRARDILLSQVANPPTLLELAHQTGLNDCKLKRGFRKIFGTTVFGYLHNHRMQQAQQLLLMPGATIAGVAQTIGYSSPEAFSVAFRRTFAISPKAYQMQQR